MWRRSTPLLVLAGSLLVSSQAVAQLQNSSLIPAALANRYGLTRSWYAQVDLDRSRGRVEHVTQHISSTRAHTVFEVAYADAREFFSERDLNKFGKRIGKDEAQKLADARVAELKAQGIDPELITRTIPEITLYVTTDLGMVHAMDGETGRTRWSARLVKPGYPNLAPAANDDYAAVINGATLIVVSAESGAVIWERTLRGAPGAGAAMSDEMVFVPLTNGWMEAFPIWDEKGRIDSTVMFSHGHAMVQPTITGNFVAWPTDRGHLNVGAANRSQIFYRLETDSAIVAPATSQPPHLFVASRSGYAYCLHEASGQILWSFSTGEPISQSPVPVGDACYIVADDFTLYRVSIEYGKEEWTAPRVKRFLSASQNRVYCLSDTEQLVVFDAATGGRVGSLPTATLDLKVPNTQTDRIYLGTSTGVIQCLHETDLVFPTIHIGEQLLVQKQRKIRRAAADDEGDKPVDTKPAIEDPFGGGVKPAADPFGGGAKPDDDDPFGGGAKPSDDSDPFGGGAKTDEDDPFGGF